MNANTNWEKLKLREIATIRRGASPRPINAKKYFSSKGRGWIRIADVSNTSKYLKETTQYLSDLGVSNSVKVEPGDVIMSICATIGKPVIIKIPACIHDGFVLFSDYKKDVNREYLFYYLQHNEYNIRSKKQVGTQGNLNTTIVGNQEILLPKLVEQTAIANILSTVDEALQKADEAITKSERIKQAMMQKLLSEGIGNKEFKQTKIGKIPKTWSVSQVKTVASIRNSSTRNDLIKVANIPMELVSENKMFCDYEVRDRNDIKSYTYCEAGDLLLAKITPSLENGKQGIVPESVPSGVAYATTEVFPIITKEIDTQFLYYILKSKKYRFKIIASMIGTTGRQRATKKSIEDLLIPIPLIAEQKEIVTMLKTIDEKLGLELERKNRYYQIKQGLMDDLLTGKKRVKIN